MELPKLELNDFIRYILGGAVGLGAAWVAYPDVVSCVLSNASAGHITLLALVLLTVGAVTYGIHRSLLHPLPLRLILWLLENRYTLGRGEVGRDPLVPTQIERKLIRRWWTNDRPEGARRWASQTHSLYCSAWTVLLVLCVGPRFHGASCNEGILWLLFSLLLTGAVLEDIRLSYTVLIHEFGDERLRETQDL